MKLYINKISPKKLKYINNYLLEKKLIEKEIQLENKCKLRKVLDTISEEEFIGLKVYLKKKKNYFSCEKISELECELDSSFETKYHYPKSVVSKFVERIKMVNPEIDEKSVLFTLYYLRHYNSFSLNALHYNVSIETFRKGVWRVLDSTLDLPNNFAYKCFKERSKYKTNLLSDPNIYFSLIVDGTFAPYKTNDHTYIGLKGKGLIYQFTIVSKIGTIVDIYGPVPASKHDIHAFFDSDIAKMNLQPGERILGNKGYRGYEDKLLVPFCENANGKGTDLNDTQVGFNFFINIQRQLAERTFRFLKYFKFLQQPWLADLDKHYNAVAFIAYLHNIAIELNLEKYEHRPIDLSNH